MKYQTQIVRFLLIIHKDMDEKLIAKNASFIFQSIHAYLHNCLLLHNMEIIIQFDVMLHLNGINNL